MTTANDILTESFGTVGKKYGYDNVTAEFVAIKDFKVKWQRTYKWADFKVSDYLLEAPRKVLDDLAETLFRKISGSEANYSTDLKEYVTSEKFLREKQPVYLRRSKKITKNEVGSAKNLRDSFNRLMEMGLVEDDENIVLSWTKENLFKKSGYCSALMKVIVISSTFDDEIVDDYVLDFVVYHHYLVMTEGKKNFGKGTELYVDDLEDKYPEHVNAKKMLAKLNIYL